MTKIASGTFVSGPLSLRDAALFTDLYELTMAAAYFREGMNAEATFSLFVRQLPPHRSFLVAAGLEEVLRFLRAFRFSADALRYLESLKRFPSAFLRYLADLRFTGDVWAVPEGTVIFGNEPLLEVTAPIIEAQLMETWILNACHSRTVLCSKAVRSVLAAEDRSIVEFGLRRTAGLDAGMNAARCAYIVGATESSNVLTGLHYGIDPTGTMAHSYITAFSDEIEAFRAFARAFPDNTILLLDTYDTVVASHKAVIVAREMEERGERLKGVRLDSGDLVTLSNEVRDILDAAGLGYVEIFASGGLDEVEVARLVEQKAPINAFGIGTRMDLSADAPYLDMAYKLVRYDGRDILKLSPGKETWAGEKQVYRIRSTDERFEEDHLALRSECPPRESAEPLLRCVFRSGKPTQPYPSLRAIRAYNDAQLTMLPDALRGMEPTACYPVRISPDLLALQGELKGRLAPQPEQHSPHGP